MNKNILFEEKKMMYIILIPFIVITLVMLLFLAVSIYGKAEDFIIWLIIGFLILPLIILLLFYQLKVVVNFEKVIASFGIGLIKKEFPISDIDIHSFSAENVRWYHGIGLRYDLKGNMLVSATTGKALSFKRKEKPTKVTIVTKKSNLLKEAIISAYKNIK